MWRPPPGPIDIKGVSAGRWWDAVSVHERMAGRVLAHLGDETGAVIRDDWGHWWYWLIPVGGAARWRIGAQQGVRILGDTAHIAVPAEERVRTIGIYWLQPYAVERSLTHPALLRAAIARARAEQ